VDTRKKIIRWPEAEDILRQRAASGSPLKVVTGHFDPLLASHSRRLGELVSKGGRLMVVVLTPPEPLLPARARAELVAALGTVEFVVLPLERDIERMLEILPQGSLVREDLADISRANELIRHVHNRQTKA